MPVAEVRPASTDDDIEAFRRLCREYARSLEYTGECRSLEHQRFDDEMATLPGRYAPACRGATLLAWDGVEAVGCVALRDLGDGICEMKRMYVRPGWRGRGIGRRLAEDVLAESRRLGYRAMRLDTGASMAAAAALYESLGFTDIPPYNRDPVAGTRWMEVTLGDHADSSSDGWPRPARS